MNKNQALKAKKILIFTPVSLVLGALFFSGVAAVINQTVWQRALKIYLSGSEALSSMIVVLVFMGGLGAGSYVVGKKTSSIKNPLKLLAKVEIALCLINLLISLILSLNISESVHVFHRTAYSIGLPLSLVYIFASTLILIVPCFLMGTTMPLVSEVSQRQLGVSGNGFISTLFSLNTFGAVGGALLSGLFLLPYFGQRYSLLIAASLNGLAGLFLLVPLIRKQVSLRHLSEQSLKSSSKLRAEEVLAFFLGFLALAYEIYLFRIVSLAHEPLPDRFSIILAFYLFFWSCGVFLSRYRAKSLSLLFINTSIFVLAIPFMFYLNVWSPNVYIFSILYSFPCLGFGLIFGRLVSQTKNNWGLDVGRFYALNTIGSCLGIVLMTFVGFRVNHFYAPIFIGISYLLLYYYSLRSGLAFRLKREHRLMTVFSLLMLSFYFSYVCLIRSYDYGSLAQWIEQKSKVKNYFGTEAVIQIEPKGELILNGLLHGQILDDSYVGTINWFQASIPMVYGSQLKSDLDVLVVGLGVGVTASTFSKSELVRSVDAYEIAPTLKEVLKDYPQRTLNILENPKIKIYWEDARKGLVLREKKYDIIVQAPLYLKQAGSSFLLSKEYFELVKSRLKEGGIFSIYSRGTETVVQDLLVRKTASQVFNYGESFLNGYLLIVSDKKIQNLFNIADFYSRVDGFDSFEKEVIEYGLNNLIDLIDSPRLDWESSRLVITDDHPLVEYPWIAKYLVLE